MAMKISTANRHLREGAKNVARNGWMSFASISSIAISLFILGLFLILADNVNYFGQQFENEVEINVYLDVNVTAIMRESLQKSISEMPLVSKVTYVSKEQALAIMRSKLGKDSEILQGMDGDNNPLPEAFNVEVKDPHQIAQVASDINALNSGLSPQPIVKVKYGQGYIDKLFNFTKIVRNVGLVFVACLTLTAMFLISNTIKLTILARDREIRIMKLVGATNGFIRWPFFVEGALLGLIGSLVPVALLTYGYIKLVDWSNNVDPSTMLVKFLPVHEVSVVLAIILFSLGIVIGVWGSRVSVRKYLKA